MQAAPSKARRRAYLDLGVPLPADKQQVVTVKVQAGGKVLFRARADAAALRESAVFTAKLDGAWSAAAASPRRPVVVMHIRRQLADAAVLLLQHMHTAKLPAELHPPGSRQQGGSATGGLGDGTPGSSSPGEEAAAAAAAAQRMLRVLLDLADYHQVSRSIDSQLQLLAAWVRARQHVSHSTVLTLLGGTCGTAVASKEYAAAREAAERYVLAALSDMDVVLSSQRLSHLLQRLPSDTLLVLLGADSTRAVAESTIVAAITLWLSSRAESAVNRQVLTALTACVRLRGLPKTFRLEVLPHLEWYRRGSNEGVLRRMETLLCMEPPIPSTAFATHRASQADEVAQQSKALMRSLGRVLEGWPPAAAAWWHQALDAPRPRSATSQLMLTGSITEARLARYFNKHCSQGPGAAATWVAVTTGCFAGLLFELAFRFVATSSGGSSSSAGGGGSSSTGAGASSTAACNNAGSQGGSGVRTWQLQLGVSFRVPGLPQGAPRPMLALQPPVLCHPAVSGERRRVTRARAQQAAGSAVLRPLLVPAGAVLSCSERLRLRLPDSQWSQGHSQQVARFADASGSVVVEVAVTPPQ